MKPFQHVSAASTEETVNILQKYGDNAEILAGGTDLLGVLKDRILPTFPELLVNIKTIPGMDYIKEDRTGLKIGSLLKLADLIDSPLVQQKYQALAAACKTVATPQIRNMGTLGGNLAQDTRCWYYRYPHAIGGRIFCARKGKGPCLALKGDNRYHAILGGKKCFAVCPSDAAVPLSLFNAVLQVAGPGGDRLIPLQDFYNPLGHVMGPSELITEIQIPSLPEKNKQCFKKYTLRKPVDFAVVSVAALLVVEDDLCKEARITLGAVAPAPWRCSVAEHYLLGKKPDETTLKEAARLAVQGAKPLSMNSYKVEIAKALTARALTECL